MPTTPVAIPMRSVRNAAAVAGPKESAKVISGNHAVRNPATSARCAKSMASDAGSAVKSSPMSRSPARRRLYSGGGATVNARRDGCTSSIEIGVDEERREPADQDVHGDAPAGVGALRPETEAEGRERGREDAGTGVLP